MKQIQRIVARACAEGIGTVEHLPAHDLGNFMGDDGREIILAARHAIAVVVSKNVGRAAEADITVRIVAGARYAESFGFGGGDPPLPAYRARRRQCRRGRRIAVGIQIFDERALELRVGNLVEISDAFAQSARAERIAADLAVANIDRDRDRIGEVAFVIIDHLHDVGLESRRRVGDARIPVDVDDEADDHRKDQYQG